jgi:hypothetical protein
MHELADIPLPGEHSAAHLAMGYASKEFSSELQETNNFETPAVQTCPGTRLSRHDMQVVDL